MAAFKTLSPNLFVSDIDASIRFYRDVLGFALTVTVPEEAPFNWAMLARDGLTVMLQTFGSIPEEQKHVITHTTPGGALSLFIEITGLEEFYKTIREHAEVVVKLHTTFYGMREFTVKDPDGWVLTFAEEVGQE